MSADIEAEFPIWNLFLEKGIPLHYIRESMSYEDVEKANAVLDMRRCYQNAFDKYYEEKR